MMIIVKFWFWGQSIRKQTVLIITQICNLGFTLPLPTTFSTFCRTEINLWRLQSIWPNFSIRWQNWSSNSTTTTRSRTWPTPWSPRTGRSSTLTKKFTARIRSQPYFMQHKKARPFYESKYPSCFLKQLAHKWWFLSSRSRFGSIDSWISWDQLWGNYLTSSSQLLL